MRQKVNFYKFDVTQNEELSFVQLMESLTQKHKLQITLVVPTGKVDYFDDFLWAQKQLSFIPHCTKNDQDLSNIAIYITDDIHDDRFRCNALMLVEPLKIMDSSVSNIIYAIPNEQQLHSFEQLYQYYKNQKETAECKMFVNQQGKWHIWE